MEKVKRIVVCDYCGFPLINTFLWAGSEKYCICCDSHSDMFSGTVLNKPSNEILLQYKVITGFWKTIVGWLIPRCTYTKTNCKKCMLESSSSHTEHLTDIEIHRNKIATIMLKNAQKNLKKVVSLS